MNQYNIMAVIFVNVLPLLNKNSNSTKNTRGSFSEKNVRIFNLHEKNPPFIQNLFISLF